MQVTMAYKDFNPDDLIVRDHLAIQRTHLANERTLLAYVRTAMFMIVTGGTIIKLLSDESAFLALGWLLILASLVVATIGVSRFMRVRRSLAVPLASPDVTQTGNGEKIQPKGA
jgi:putative membrane protein